MGSGFLGVASNPSKVSPSRVYAKVLVTQFTWRSEKLTPDEPERLV